MFSGFAMVITLLLVTRKVYKLEDYITIQHIEMMNIIIIVTGSIVGIAYITEFFIAWYGANSFEFAAFADNRVNPAKAPYWWAYWTMITCNVVFPQLFWVRRFRQSPLVTWIVASAVTLGLWF